MVVMLVAVVDFVFEEEGAAAAAVEVMEEVSLLYPSPFTDSWGPVVVVSTAELDV